MLRSISSINLLLLLALFMMPAAASAQQTRVLQDDDWCDQNWNDDRDAERYCEVREVTLAADRSTVRVDGRQNGGIRVEGWDRDEILVRARIEANAPSEADARELASAVRLQTDRPVIAADVPRTRERHTRAFVSYEIFVPRQSNLDLETHNGGIEIESVEGDIAFDALNGGVTLRDLGGRVTGETTNGGLEIVLTGDVWRGDGLDVETTNGGVELFVPERYSADLETGTVNGRVDLGFPVMVQGRLDRQFSTTLGNGGARIRVKTVNGGVSVRRS